jgi:hypothetical protein
VVPVKVRLVEVQQEVREVEELLQLRIRIQDLQVLQVKEMPVATEAPQINLIQVQVAAAAQAQQVVMEHLRV